MSHPLKESTGFIGVVDLGGQYCHLISRRLRELGFQSKTFTGPIEKDALNGCRGIILSGGPRSISEDGSVPEIDSEVLEFDIPVLGICYGHQFLAKHCGGRVARGSMEYGPSTLTVTTQDGIFSGTPAQQAVWMSHSDTVVELPRDAITLAFTDRCKHAAFTNSNRQIFGVQFHPEVVHTEFGLEILRNFGERICAMEAMTSNGDVVAQLRQQIKNEVGDRSVFFFVSGGVDSTVAFVLCAEALSRDRVLAVYVDTGLMRRAEIRELDAILKVRGLRDRLRIRKEEERFFEALKNVRDPEQKREIIGRLFVEIQSEAMKEYGITESEWMLGQGTIYPDTIESGDGGGKADKIKTHHNRCPEIVQLMKEGKVIEPLARMYKDEVRDLAKRLKLGNGFSTRWPFPGPGLAIRCLCSSEKGSATPKDWPGISPSEQAVVFPLKTVGVQGDGRTYRNVAAIGASLDYQRLERLSSSICNADENINRVIVPVGSRTSDLSLGSISVAGLTSERIELLRDADNRVRTIMEEAGHAALVWQFPVVLVPISFEGGESLVLRPISSVDGMTAGVTHLSAPLVEEIAHSLEVLPGIDQVFMDVTPKPPATIEWE